MLAIIFVAIEKKKNVCCNLVPKWNHFCVYSTITTNTCSCTTLLYFLMIAMWPVSNQCLSPSLTIHKWNAELQVCSICRACVTVMCKKCVRDACCAFMCVGFIKRQAVDYNQRVIIHHLKRRDLVSSDDWVIIFLASK